MRTNPRNLQECYNDAVYYREELRELFKRGQIRLRELSLAEDIFLEIVRGIVRELHDSIDFCVYYGRTTSTGAVQWMRHIKVEWDVFTGYPSTQNRITTIPSWLSAGSPAAGLWLEIRLPSLKTTNLSLIRSIGCTACGPWPMTAVISGELVSFFTGLSFVNARSLGDVSIADWLARAVPRPGRT